MWGVAGLHDSGGQEKPVRRAGGGGRAAHRHASLQVRGKVKGLTDEQCKKKFDVKVSPRLRPRGALCAHYRPGAGVPEVVCVTESSTPALPLTSLHERE